MSRSKLFFIYTALAAIALLWGCKSKPSANELMVPGVSAGGILVGVDDNVAVVKKLGEPDYKSVSAGGNSLWMYTQKGMGIVFGSGSNIYKGINVVDSTVGQIFLFNTQVIDNKKFSRCVLRTADGLTLESKATDIFKLYGEPTLKQAPLGTALDENFTGVLYYPGLEASFQQGWMRWLSVIYLPSGDPAVAKRVEQAPIIPGNSIGGITLGMTEDEVRGLLGDTRYKYQKLNADFWYYPQYAIKVQFGIPPIEGQLVNKFTDTTYLGKVTGITAVPKGYFEGVLSPEQYTGTMADSIGISTPAYIVHQKLGEPAEPLTTLPSIGAVRGKYNGIVFYFDPRTQAVDHILVENTGLDLPLEEVAH